MEKKLYTIGNIQINLQLSGEEINFLHKFRLSL